MKYLCVFYQIADDCYYIMNYQQSQVNAYGLYILSLIISFISLKKETSMTRAGFEARGLILGATRSRGPTASRGNLSSRISV